MLAFESVEQQEFPNDVERRDGTTEFDPDYALKL